MDIVLKESASKEEIVAVLKTCKAEDAICCQSEALFLKAKAMLIQEKLKNITIQLLDSDGYAIKQVTSKPADKSKTQDHLNARQIKVITALEKVLQHCKKEGVQLVGYSDELVALPAHIPMEDISSAGALDINCHGVYKGADAVISSEDR